jgi:ATP-dependent Clp protease protease subunit
MAGKIVRDSIDHFFDYGLHVETRTIYLGDSIDQEVGVGPVMADHFIKAMVLFNQTPDKPIKVILNTLGGSWYDGMAIYDAIKASPCHVRAEVLGSAMSMGSIIIQAADERIAHPNSVIMIHDGGDMFEGHARNFEVWGKNSALIRHRMYEIYAERSNKPVKYWEKRCTVDYILNAHEAKAEGLIDEVLT